MKKIFCILLSLLLLCGCSGAPAATEPSQQATETTAPLSTNPPETGAPAAEISFESRYEQEILIHLSDDGVTHDTPTGLDPSAVSVGGDIIYYEDRETYDSGNPYGEGEAHERHSADEANAHTVVTITAPGRYRVTGKLSAGQILVDLGEEAYEDPNALVELILDNADITCTVAPAILFLNVYECDGNWSEDTAKADVDTSAAGANLILEGENVVDGSYVARIYKDKEGEKKLWKQDGAIYSYMSMNVFGPGSLDLTAENEGLDTELHLTVNGGDITIRSGNDGINTNEDNVSVTTINGGRIHILAGLGEEGDGIDSNGYLVINGGTVIASANPAADAGLDSDLGSYINGGTVIAFGSAMDWAESDSHQVTMNLQFAQYCEAGSNIRITDENGQLVFSFDPGTDELLMNNARRFQGAIISCPAFQVGETYLVYLNGVQQAYTGTDVTMMRPGGMPGDQRPDGFGGGQPPEGFGGQQGGNPPALPEGETFPEGEMPTWPEGETRPEDFTTPEGDTMPQGETRPGGMEPPADGNMGNFGSQRPGSMGGMPSGETNSLFYMQDKVNFFSGLTAYTNAE